MQHFSSRLYLLVQHFCFVLFVCLVVGGGGGGEWFDSGGGNCIQNIQNIPHGLSSQYSCTLASPSIDVPRVVGIICDNFV